MYFIRAIPNYFIKHWKGNVSLGKSFWLNFVFVLCIFDYIKETVEPETLSSASNFFALLGICRGIVYIWQFVGCWRSAKIQKSKAKDPFAGNAVQILLLGSLLYLFHLVPIYLNHIKTSIGVDGFSEYYVHVTGHEIIVNGYFSMGLEEEIKTILSENENILGITFNSPGGSINVAEKIAELVREYELLTHTEYECSSACVIPFLEGTSRVLGENAKIGWHSVSVPGFSKEEELILSLALSMQNEEYYKSKGISEEFLYKAFNTPSDEMWYPTVKELADNNIITHQVKKGKIIKVKNNSNKLT